jgi:hypothetical protein
MTPRARERRFSRLKEMGCLAHWMDGVPNVAAEIHHQNLGGKAGQKRIGDHATVPLCCWHHRSEPFEGFTKSQMVIAHGPSLAGQSKAFRKRYGSDEKQLAKTNDLIEQLDGIAA